MNTFISIAEKYVGVSENPVGSNRGPLIDRWNTNVNAPLGSFWCASFVSAVAMEWEAQSGSDWPLCVSADCDVWLANARKNKCISQKGRPGDIVILVSGNDAYHIGIVTGYSETGTLVSVEGNSNNDGSRNGYMVAKRSNLYHGRNKDNVYFIRPWDLITVDTNVDWNVYCGSNNRLGEIINSKVYMPVRRFLELVNGSDAGLTWDDGPVFNGKPLGIQCVVRNGVSYGYIRDLASRFNYTVRVNTEKKRIDLEVKSP